MDDMSGKGKYRVLRDDNGTTFVIIKEETVILNEEQFIKEIKEWSDPVVIELEHKPPKFNQEQHEITVIHVILTALISIIIKILIG
jgi:hypothetical protein